MKAFEVNASVGMLHKIDKENEGVIYGKIYRIEEYFKNEEELLASGRREVYQGFEQDTMHRYKDGSIGINSFCFIYPNFIDQEKEIKDFDPRFFAVANLYPYIFEKSPEYLKGFINPKYYKYKMLINDQLAEIFDKDTIAYEIRLLEDANYLRLVEGKEAYENPVDSSEVLDLT